MTERPDDGTPATGLDPVLQGWLAEQVGEVNLVRQLVGGITSQMLQLRRTDGSGDIVVRRWSGERDWEARMVRTEAAGLVALADTDLPAPRLVVADPDGTNAGRPTTVTTFLAGAVDLTPIDQQAWIRQLAAMLVRIHGTTAIELPPCDVWSRDDPDWLDDRGLITEATALAARPPAADDRVLSHGDYQHFNLLWQDQQLVNVVDWTNIGTASRGLDVGHCRLNLAVLYSPDAAMQFLDDYEQLAGVRVDPAPDLQQLLCFGTEWQDFIPTQVAGRTTIDGPGMASRVQETVLRTLQRAD